MTRDEALTMAREVTGLTLVSNGRKMTDAQIVVMCQAAYERGAADRIDADAERIKALEADSERYRWLRRMDHFAAVDAMLNTTDYDTLDAAIDAARSKT